MRKDHVLARFAEHGLRYPQKSADEGYFTSDDCRIHYATFGNGPPSCCSTAAWAGIRTPVTVIQGVRDEFIRLDHAEHIANSLGNGRFECLDGLGHYAPIEDPEKFNEVMLRHVKSFAIGR